MIKIFVALVAFCSLNPAYAWLGLQHRLINRVVEKKLSPPVKELLTPLLTVAIESYPIEDIKAFATFEDASVWMDFTKHPTLNDLYKCHFLDLSIDLPLKKEPENNIVEKMKTRVDASTYNLLTCSEWAATTLAHYFANPKTFSQSSAALALRFILHLVADLHQPMHLATAVLKDQDTDRGGNKLVFPSDTKFEFLKSSKDFAVNLHFFVDAGMDLYPLEERDAAMKPSPARNKLLAQEILKLEAFAKTLDAPHLGQSFRDWMVESHEIARLEIYAKLEITAPDARGQWGIKLLQPFSDFKEANKHTVYTQLWKAATRLAWLLNSLHEQKHNHPFVINHWPPFFPR